MPDAEGRVIASVNPENNVTRTEYNSLGDEIATIDALGRRSEFRYNDRGLLIETIFPDASPDDLGTGSLTGDKTTQTLA